MPVIIKTPSSCSEKECKDFRRLAVKSGEVQVKRLSDLIQNAKALAFLCIDGKNVGIAGLKVPRSSHRSDVFNNAKSKHAPEDFPYELGWVYIEQDHRKQGHSFPLVEKVLAHAEGSNVYATSRKTQTIMHRTLCKCRFVIEGDPWRSSPRDDELLLFILDSSRSVN